MKKFSIVLLTLFCLSQSHVAYSNDAECLSANDSCEKTCKRICLKACPCPENCASQDGDTCAEDCQTCNGDCAQACADACAEDCNKKRMTKNDCCPVTGQTNAEGCCPATGETCGDACAQDCADACDKAKKDCPYATKSITWETAAKSSKLKFTVKKADDAKEKGWERIKEIVQAAFVQAELPVKKEDDNTYSMSITKGEMTTEEWVYTLNYARDFGMEVIEELEQDDVATGGIISIELTNDDEQEMTEESANA